jgi:hypothetical protein
MIMYEKGIFSSSSLSKMCGNLPGALNHLSKDSGNLSSVTNGVLQAAFTASCKPVKYSFHPENGFIKDTETRC